jgi:hypothetical protein
LSFVLREFVRLRRHHNRELLEQINAAALDLPEPSEQARLAQMQRFQRRAIGGEW